MKYLYIIQSDNFEKIHYVFCMGTTAAALSYEVTFFFSGKSINSILDDKNFNWKRLNTENNSSAENINKLFLKKGLVGFEELVQSSIKLDIKFLYCSMLNSLTENPFVFLDKIKIKPINLASLYLKNNNSKIIYI